MLEETIPNNKMVHAVRAPHESFFNKSVRLANQGVQIMGTLKGVYDAGKMIYAGAQTVAPLLAML